MNQESNQIGWFYLVGIIVICLCAVVFAFTLSPLLLVRVLNRLFRGHSHRVITRVFYGPFGQTLGDVAWDIQ